MTQQSPIIEFWFDFSSPYAFFASLSIEEIAARHRRSVQWRPFMLGVLFKATGALVQRASELLDSGARCTRQVSEAKLFCTEAAVDITSDAVQIHGAYGYVEDLPVERYFRDARVGPIWEGTSEIQQQIICRELGLYGE